MPYILTKTADMNIGWRNADTIDENTMYLSRIGQNIGWKAGGERRQILTRSDSSAIGWLEQDVIKGPTNFNVVKGASSVTNPAQNTDGSGTMRVVTQMTITANNAINYKIFTNSALTSLYASGNFTNGTASWTWDYSATVSAANVSQSLWFVAYNGDYSSSAVKRTLTLVPNRYSQDNSYTEEGVEGVSVEYTFYRASGTTVVPGVGEVQVVYYNYSPKQSSGTLLSPAVRTGNTPSHTVSAVTCKHTKDSTAVTFMGSEGYTPSSEGIPPTTETITASFNIPVNITTYTTYYYWNGSASIS